MNKTKLPRIRLVAMDLDDTLLNEDLQISPENKAALLAAQEAGITLVLASGRPSQAIAPYAQVLGLDKAPHWILAYNGASILESDTGKEYSSCKLSPQLLEEIWDTSKALGQALQTYSDQDILLSDENEYTRKDTELTGIPWRLVDKQEFISEARVKVILPGDPDVLEEVQKVFKQKFGSRVNQFTSKPYFFEIMNPKADKGLALEKLCAHLEIKQEEAAALGDAMNDYGMIFWAGSGIAMANADPRIKKIARYITSRNHQDHGVAEAFERWILPSHD